MLEQLKCDKHSCPVYKQLEGYIVQTAMCHKISKLMQSTIQLDRILHIILTCVTAGYGFGFNRALLLLINKRNNILEGTIAVAPVSEEEAYKIWKELSHLDSNSPDFDDIIKIYDEVFHKRDSPIDTIARQIKISLEDNNIFSECIVNKKSFIITDAKNNPKIERDFLNLWGTDIFAIVPLIARDNVVGIIVADNLYNARPITDEHMEQLSGFASHAGLAIENARLYENLKDKVEELETLNERLEEIHSLLLRSEKLSTLGEMAAIVSHELRSPLVSIGGYARLILEGKDKKAQDEYVKIIIKEVMRLEKIVRDILDFVKPIELFLKMVNINKLIEDVLLFFQTGMLKENIYVIQHLDHQLPLVPLDPERFKQVLINIFENALDAMIQGGELTIRTYQQDKFVKIEITDTGIGIPDEHLERIIKPFFTTKPHGIGLGLSISNKIIQGHSGSLDINSTEEQGSTFIISLPTENKQSQMISK